MSTTLKPEQVRYEPASWGDPNGRVFYWEDDLYRAVTPTMAPVYRAFLRDRRLGHLFESRLIETELTPLTLEGYGLVLKHRRIPFVSYPFEWCGEMLKAAALCTLDLSIELAAHGYELQDANPWNVLFEGCAPRHVDFGSIIPAAAGKDWRPREEFVKSFLNPLVLLAHGHGPPAREALADHTRWGVSDDEMPALLSPDDAEQWRSHLGARRWGGEGGRTETLRRLREGVEAIPFNAPETEWSGYYDDYYSPDAMADWSPKQRNTFDILRRTPARSVLDAGCNAGWFSRMAAAESRHVVAFDVDETCVTRLYRGSRSDGLPILPLVMNLTKPSPAYGPDRQYPDAATRLRCDLVLALAMVHHLVFKQRMTFDAIVSRLGGFSNRWLLIEWIPREDRYVQEWYTPAFTWYGLDGFVTALRRVFPRIETFESNRLPRKLLFCEK